MEQVKHAIETGALRPGEQLPGIRPLAEELVINPNTVAKAYRELEHEGVIELRHGAGAFVSGTARAKKVTDKLRAGQAVVAAAIERLRESGVTDEEIRRLFEAELAGLAPAERVESIVADPCVDRNRRPAEALRRRRGAPRPEPAGARRIHLRVPRKERRRQDDDDQGAARHGAARRAARPASSACRRRARAERGDSPPHRRSSARTRTSTTT